MILMLWGREVSDVAELPHSTLPSVLPSLWHPYGFSSVDVTQPRQCLNRVQLQFAIWTVFEYNHKP